MIVEREKEEFKPVKITVTFETEQEINNFIKATKYSTRGSEFGGLGMRSYLTFHAPLTDEVYYAWIEDIIDSIRAQL